MELYMKRTIFVIGFAAASLAAIAQTTLGPVIVTAPPPPPTMPTVTVHATKQGGTVLCTGQSCADVIASLTGTNTYVWVEDVPIEDEPAVDKAQFCSALKNSRPSNCNLASPPPSPGIGSNWQPNSCGTGPVVNSILSLMINLSMHGAYSGDFEAPHSGVSFRNACNGHDQCWANGMDKGSCDYSFFANMNNACAQAGSGQAACEGFAATYFGAVSNATVAHIAYHGSVAARHCALWAHDMKSNNCGS